MTAQPSLLHLHVERHQAMPSQYAGLRKLTWFFQGFGLAGLMLIGVWLVLPLPSLTDSPSGSANPLGREPALAFNPAVPGIRTGGLRRPGGPGPVQKGGLEASALLDPPVLLDAPKEKDNVVVRTGDVKMINLFGNSEESKQRRADLSLRGAKAGSRVVTFAKPNMATDGLMLGLKFKEGFGKAVYIDKILPRTEAAKLKSKGLINEGDEVVMVSATFGDELWSARGVGKMRLEKSISVRQGMWIKFALESSDSDSKARQKQLSEEAKKQGALQSRLQKQLAEEVESEKNKGGGWFR